MHSLFFEMKQSHLSAVRFCRTETEPVGLTPARLDMVRAILERGGSCLQSFLRHTLCVTKTTTSVMVRALEKIGFVTRKRSIEDRRTYVVELTELARWALREVFAFITRGFFALAMVGAFAKDRPLVSGPWAITMWRLMERLKLFRQAFGIGMRFDNPWDPNDDDYYFYYDPEILDNPNTEDLVPEEDDVFDDEDRARWPVPPWPFPKGVA